MDDLDAVLERFDNELRLRRELCQELSPMRFSEHELKEIIYLLRELKFRREIEYGKNQGNNQAAR